MTTRDDMAGTMNLVSRPCSALSCAATNIGLQRWDEHNPEEVDPCGIEKGGTRPLPASHSGVENTCPGRAEG